MRRLLIAVAAVIVVAMTAAPSAQADTGRGRHDAPAVHTDFDPKEFRWGAFINNRYLPLVPGTQFVLEGTANGGTGSNDHSIVLTVTDLVKKVDGVRSRVLWDVDRQNGVVAEAELAFVAQDDDGNVWHTGEYPEEYPNGVFGGAPRTWIGGVSDALAGVAMRVNPQPGTSSYYQALVPSIKFGDIAKVNKIHPTFCIKLGCYKNVVEILEKNSFFPSEGKQLKYYAPGVGNIRIDFIGGTEQEVLELVKINHLGRDALADANAAALRLDRHAYQVAPDIYGGTPRATVARPDD